MRDWDWDYGASEDPEYRKKAVSNKLFGPLGISLETADVIGGAPESPAEAERKAKQAKDQLAKHDQFWGIKPGDLIPDIYKVHRATVEAGDPDGDHDLS